MRRIAAYTVLLFVVFNLFRLTTTGIRAYSNGVFIPFIIMLPGTLSMLISLIFFSDIIYFNCLKLNPLKTFIVCISLFSSTFFLLLFGNFLTTAVDTVGLIPMYVLYFIWFPFLILFLKRFFKQPL